MAVLDAKENQAASTAKPEGSSGDQAVARQVADHSIADPHKLHADSYPKAKSTATGGGSRLVKPETKPETKPGAKLAAVNQPGDLKPGAAKTAATLNAGDKSPAENANKAALNASDRHQPPVPKPAPANQGLFGWITGAEDYATDAWKSVVAKAAQAKDEVTNAASSTIAAVEAVATATNSAVPTGNKALDTTVKPVPGGKPASESSTESGISWALAKVKEYARAGVDAVVGKENEEVVIQAAESVAPAAMAVVGAGMGLPTMIGYAGAAATGFSKYFDFGDGSAESNFNKVALHVDNIDDVKINAQSLTTDPETMARDQQIAEKAAKAAGVNWMFAGDDTAGGGASIIGENNRIEAKGKNKDGVAVEATSTPDSQAVEAGGIRTEHDANGLKVTGKSLQIIRKNGVITVQDLLHNRQVVLDPALHTWTVIDGNLHTSVSSKGAVTNLDDGKQIVQTTGNILDATVKPGLDKGITTQYLVDKHGNMEAITSSGNVYKYYAEQQKLEIERDHTLLRMNFKTHKVEIFSVDPKTGALTAKPVDQKHLPKGWKVLPDGTVDIEGAKVAAIKENVLHIAGSLFDRTAGTLNVLDATNTATTATVTKKDGGTELTTKPGAPKIDVSGSGDITIKSDGESPIVYHAKTQSIEMDSPDGSSVNVNQSGAVDMKQDGESVAVDPRGNVTALDSNKQLLYSMNSNGDLHLWDGTNISHTGAVENKGRHISEPSYNGQSASDVVNDAAASASSLAALINVPGSLDASIAALEGVLAMLNSLGDVPGLAEQIGIAKATVEARLYQAEAKEGLNSRLFQAGLDNDAIENAFRQRASGHSDSDIVQIFTQPALSA